MEEKKSEHTPGPWGFDHFFREIQGSDGYSLDDQRFRSDTEVIANRTLRLAAPDLLAACEADQEWLFFVGGLSQLDCLDPVNGARAGRLYEQANALRSAAIAKARGDSA